MKNSIDSIYKVLLLAIFWTFSTVCYPTSLASSPVQDYGLAYSPELEQEVTLEFECKFESKPHAQPVLILIGGFQGSGKSSLVARIKEIYDVNVISTDSIRQSLFDRGLKVSSEFAKYVSNISINLVKKSLKAHSNLVIDANSHSKRIAEMEKLLNENNAHHSTIKLFLNASDETLRNRVKARKQTLDCYQGTESDLEAALSSVKIHFADYDLIVNTDQLSESDVFKQVNNFILPYFRLQDPAKI